MLERTRSSADGRTEDRRELSEPLRVKRVPGEEGVWIFIIGDLMIFAVLFGVFLYYRNLEVDVFQSAKLTLNQTWGALNTFLLLTSSWFVASAVKRVRLGTSKTVTYLFAGGFACGLAFVIVKYFEYGEKIRDGISIQTNNFYMFYFVLTGVHLLHVIVGLIVLSFLINKSRTAETEATDIQLYEGGGVYWHMVDLLWIVLFALLYLVA